MHVLWLWLIWAYCYMYRDLRLQGNQHIIVTSVVTGISSSRDTATLTDKVPNLDTLRPECQLTIDLMNNLVTSSPNWKGS